MLDIPPVGMLYLNMPTYPSHKKYTDALKRIEGQVCGVQRMIDEKRYCVDILVQLSAIGSAVASVQNKILEKHLDTCFKTAFEKGTSKERDKKIAEVVKILKNFRKIDPCRKKFASCSCLDSARRICGIRTWAKNP